MSSELPHANAASSRASGLACAARTRMLTRELACLTRTERAKGTESYRMAFIGVRTQTSTELGDDPAHDCGFARPAILWGWLKSGSVGRSPVWHRLSCRWF